MGNKSFAYEGVSVECQPDKVAVSYDTDRCGVGTEDAGFLELVVIEGQKGRLDKRHASATDHADNICH